MVSKETTKASVKSAYDVDQIINKLLSIKTYICFYNK